MKGLLQACVQAWQKAWNPGSLLVADETMVQWEGVSSAHLTYIVRKPTPLGFELRTLVDGDSGVLLNAELCEGAELEDLKDYVEEWGKHTAATLRLTEPY